MFAAKKLGRTDARMSPERDLFRLYHTPIVLTLTPANEESLLDWE